MGDGYFGRGSETDPLYLYSQERSEKRSGKCYSEKEKSFRVRYRNHRYTQPFVRLLLGSNLLFKTSVDLDP